MIIIPAIDLRGGQVVRLRQGDFDQQTTYGLKPQELACAYQNDKGDVLHIVDLDGARAGESSQASTNMAVIGELVQSLSMPVQTGGGIRTMDDVSQRFELGVSRVVIGSLCIRQPELFETMLSEFGPERIVAALDVHESDDGRFYPATHGWQKAGETPLESVLERFVNAGLRHCLCTDIGRDGMLSGPNVTLYQSIRQQFPQLVLQASGGVSSLDDLTALDQAGIDAVILGKSLLEGRFTLADAVSGFGQGRVPA